MGDGGKVFVSEIESMDRVCVFDSNGTSFFKIGGVNNGTLSNYLLLLIPFCIVLLIISYFFSA